MRIRNSGSGFSGFSNDSRSSSFRQGRRPGQKVRGKLLKWISEDMAWVEIEGHKLLARLQSTPLVGAHLTFVIKQLQPEIVLKEIFAGRTASASALEMAASFEASRILFENKFRQYTRALSTTPPTNRPMAFTMFLSQDMKLLLAYQDVLNCARAITENTGKGHSLLYQPWLVPEGRRLATIFHTPATPNKDSLVASLVEFEIARFGMVRIEFLHKAKQTGYRLKLQHPDKSNALKKYLNTRSRTALIGNIQCLGIDKLRQREHGGILAELMFTK